MENIDTGANGSYECVYDMTFATGCQIGVSKRDTFDTVSFTVEINFARRGSIYILEKGGRFINHYHISSLCVRH